MTIYKQRPPLELLPAHEVQHTELPQDTPAERAVLSSVLSNREVLLCIADWLTPEMFYAHRNGAIYGVMLNLLAQRITPDLSNVSAAIGEHERDYLIALVTDDHYIPSLIDTYAARIVAAHQRRFLMDAGHKIVALGADDRLTTDERSAQAHSLLTAATAGADASDLVSGSDAVSEAWDTFHSEAPPYTSSGWPDLDMALGGLHGGDFIVVAARPAVGKTAWGLSLLRNLCLRGACVPLLFSLEMGREQIVHRLVAMESGIETRVLRMRQIPDDATHQLLADAHGVVGSWQWTVSDLSGQTAAQIRARTMRHTAEHPQTVVLVDYLGLMGSDRARENRTQEVSAMSLALKNLARDAGVCVIALCQLSRAVEGRASHVPMLSDLRDSGSIEQDSDAVLMLYREELYDPKTDKRGIAELHIAKNRHGPCDVLPYRFDPCTTRFDALVRHSHGGEPC